MLKIMRWPTKSIWGALFILIRTLGALAIQKLIAILYGPAGTTLFSHFQNFISLFTQPVQNVLAQGLISAYPNKDFSKNNLYITATIILLAIFTATGLILWLSGSIPTDLFSFSTYSWVIILLAILIICFQSIASSILIAQQKLKILSFIHLAQWITIISFLSYWNEAFLNTLLFYVIILAFFSLVFFGFLQCELKQFQFKNYTVDKKIIHHFNQFLWMGLAVWLSSKWVDFFIREYAIQLFGESETGLWQAVSRISEAYRGLFISFLLVTFYPTVSDLLTKHLNHLKSYLKKQMVFYTIFTLSFLLFIYIFHPYIIQVLYSQEYLSASLLFKIQIVGDVLAFISFPLALVLMATLKTKAYVICELLSASIYVLCIYFGSYLGIEILVYAHIGRFFIYLIAVLFFTRKFLKFA